MELTTKKLLGKLNRTCRQSLDQAAALCLSRTNYNVEIEHWFAKLLEDPGNDVAKILRFFEINPDSAFTAVSRALDRLKTGNGNQPGLAPSLMEAISEAWSFSSVEYNLSAVRSGALLAAIFSKKALAASLREASKEFDKIIPQQLRDGLLGIVAGSSEDAEVGLATTAGPSPAPGQAPKGPTKTPNLDQYTIDLTANARAGKIDPVLGRDMEIRQIIDILTRRRQNNPILTGEAGVGKTAVVEGFASRIAAGDVPPALRNVSLRSLDLGLLQAGAGVKGEFENRLKSVIQEVNSSPTPVILFIDEAHTLIGAGGQAGQGDAANLLKPALARGELRTIAATTWAEYKKYFEKDAALTRRFQVVKVEEPSEEIAIAMMRGFAETLEGHHGVDVLDEAVQASVRLSARYISGRQLPDKCVSLLDTACARVAISQSATPPPIEDRERRIMLLETERRMLEGEEATGTDHGERLEVVRKELEETRASLEALRERWTKESDLVEEIRETRSKLTNRKIKKASTNGQHAAGPAGKVAKDAALPAGQSVVVASAPASGAPSAGGTEADSAALVAPLSDADKQTFRKALDELMARLKQIQGTEPLSQPFVDSQTVAEVISAWTGIPAGRMMADEIQTILRLKDLLAERVVGQDHGLEAIAKRIQTSRANMDDPQKPIGVFLLVGPSGVGKTETAISLAELLYGGQRNMVTINMSEYQEAHTVSSLKGSPPGYVGYGEGGVLTEAVRRKPYSVVLLDEVEKAHPDVMELFFQVFDKGVLEDGEGREIDFKNTVILLTSNVATDKIMSLCADPETRPDPEGLAEAIHPDLVKVFPPALLGRLVISTYYPITDEVMKRIIRLKLGKIVRRVFENHGVPLTYDDALVDMVASRCTEVSSGARNVDNILTNTLLPELSREFLSRLADGSKTQAIHVTIGPDDQFAYQFS